MASFDPKSEWVKAALDDLENGDLSYEELAKKYGRSRSAMQKLKTQFNIKRKLGSRFVGMRKTAELKSLSPEHRSIGMKLTVYRGPRLVRQLAAELGVSPHRAKMMELGIHDFSLEQLKLIASLLKVTIQSLVAPINEKFTRRP